ncbi:M14 family metallopeptidase [Porifericola rhodea]|uniref:M14 metallopeptidase family protein n=1 Tax=Porifericola rhodea TaxID=930972 RepID=UPI0026656D44|nr:M14 metallopeptidase family protein [Porifericola rhodea]WKN33821.1 M14 family metallopeptidase [Porifericola rhodea]
MTYRLLLVLSIFLPGLLSAQQPDLQYYLPEGASYRSDVPTPESVLGFQIGERHAEHTLLMNYYRALAEASPRVTLVEYAQTYEKRPLFLLTITSENNQNNIEEVKSRHVQLSNPEASASVSVDEQPVVVWLGYSVHGNEPSGTNAAPLVAYHLAAAQGSEVEEMLENTVVLMDPFINPDGINRFATWANTRRAEYLSTDPNNIEQNEHWPRGRTNHYWFDLNRDWLLQQHPESRGRLEKFHEWKPNIVTDHHEMGSNATFFFQPGIPSRNNPLTPENTFRLTEALGDYHAEGLDAIGSFYYTKESYDDFYYGKGSTYPDVNGAVGILFEQASSRSHAQETDNGLLTFPFTIRNQVSASFSTLKGALALKNELLQHQVDFYPEALELAAQDPIKAFVFGSEADAATTYHMAEVLKRHQIQMYRPAQRINANGHSFEPESSYLVPTNQAQYRLIKALFERRTSFNDSLFYDVSAWTFPLAYNLPFAELNSRQLSLGKEVEQPQFPQGELVGGRSEYAYLFEVDEYYAHRAIYRLQEAGLNLKISTEAFTHKSGRRFDYGTILVPISIQKDMDAEAIYELMQTITKEDGINVYAANTGMSSSGVSLGSRTYETLEKPEIIMLIEGGVSSYEAGEAWHLLDQRMHMPITMMSAERFNRSNLNRYNTLIMVDGSYNDINESGKSKLKLWIQQGNKVVAIKDAGKWLSDNGIGGFKYKSAEKDSLPQRAFADRDKHRGAQVIGGSIFSATVDLSHPIAYGMNKEDISLFRDHSLFMERANNPYANPLMYTEQPLRAGYISEEKEEQLRGTAGVGIASYGQGVVIALTDNPNFRAFWYGTNKLFLNSIFFGKVMR